MIPVALGLALGAVLLPAPQAAPPRSAPTIATLRQGEGAHRLALPVTAGDDEVAARRPSLVRGQLARFLESEGRGWRVVWDRRSGLPMLFEGPGLGLNDVSGEAHARGLMQRYPGAFDADGDVEIDGAPDGDSDLQFVRFKKRSANAYGARLTFVVNHGRLIQIHAEKWLSPRNARPGVTADEALATLREQAQVPSDPIGLTVELTEVALATTDEAPGVYTGVFGGGYETHTVYSFRFRLAADVRTFVAYVDAESGDLLDLFDDNKYEGHVRGGVFPRTSGAPEIVMPLAGLTVVNGTAKITDLGGGYDYSGGTASTALSGAHIAITDACGAPAASAISSPGDLDLGTSPGTDCSFSASGHSTRAARNAFYHLNNVIGLGRKWLGGVNAKAESWFASNVQVNVNISQTCNGYWDGSTLNFFKSGSGCNNTGEISDVMQHEWGHGLDENTKSGSVGDSAKGEAVADAVAMLMTRDACIAPNFFVNGGGETQSCPDGVRDLSFVVTKLNISSVCPRSSSCAGALGFECHCESHLLSGAYWKLAQLFTQRYGEDEGWNRFEKGFLRAFQNTTSYLTGAAGNAYDAWMAADDDNGNVVDGTPNADIIFQAFNAQGIAGTQRAAFKAACVNPPAPPIVTAQTGPGGIDLSWNVVAGASSYSIFRRMLDGPPTFLPLAAGLTGASYTDTQTAAAFSYRYQVVAVAAACASPYGAGVSATAGTTSGVDFSIAASPAQVTVAAGSSATVTVTTAVTNGYAQTVALSISGLPSGVSASFSPATIVSGGSSTLTLLASANAPAVVSTVNITGTAVSGAHAASISLTVTSNQPADDFALSLSPTSIAVASGASSTTTVSTAVVSGAAQSLALSVSGLPAGVTGAFSPATVTAGGSSTLTLTAASGAAATTTGIVVSGTGSSAVHTASATLTVGSTGGIVNGGFEAGLSAWTVSGAASISASAHSGSGAAIVGSTTPTSGDSSVSQTFTAPTTIVGAALSFWYSVHCPDTVAYDWATATLRDNAAGTTTTLLPKTCTNSGAWTQVSAALIAGRSYTLTLTAHDDNYAGDATYVRFDDVGITVTPAASGIVNGGFETGTFSGWTTTGTTSITTVSHSGSYAAVVGSANPTNGDSTIRQTFTAPSTQVSLYYATRCPDVVTYDWVTITLRDNTAGTTSTLVPRTCPAIYAWTSVTAGTTAGHSYTLTILSHDDAYSGDATYTLVDDVSTAAPVSGTIGGNTAAGLSVNIALAGVTLTFESVHGEGMTTATPVAEEQAQKLDLPPGFARLPGSSMMIDTDASFSGSVSVCLDGSSLDPGLFADAVVLHGINGLWEAQPTGRDATSRQLCALVTSFSPFAIGVITDHTAPTIEIFSPAPAPAYHVGDVVFANYGCSDADSGVAACEAPVGKGEAIDTSTAGTRSFQVHATDRAGNSSSRSVTYQVVKIDPVIAWPPPAAIVVGTPLSAAQLNATADVSGSFTYSPPPGALLSLGVQTLTAAFTPADTTRYNIGHASTTITVTAAIVLRYDASHAAQSGSTVPIAIQVIAAAGSNLSSASLTVVADGIAPAGGTVAWPPQSAGNANAGAAFRFTGGQYLFNLKTTALSAGAYELLFHVAGDPSQHRAPFNVR